MTEPAVRELRLAVTATELGPVERATYSSAGERVTILEAGRVTLVLSDPTYALHRRGRGRTTGGRARPRRVRGRRAHRDPVELAELPAGGPAGLHLTLFSELG